MDGVPIKSSYERFENTWDEQKLHAFLLVTASCYSTSTITRNGSLYSTKEAPSLVL